MKIKILAVILMTAFSLQFASAAEIKANTLAAFAQLRPPPPPPAPPRIHIKSPFRHRAHRRVRRAHRLNIRIPAPPRHPAPGLPPPPPRP